MNREVAFRPVRVRKVSKCFEDFDLTVLAILLVGTMLLLRFYCVIDLPVCTEHIAL